MPKFEQTSCSQCGCDLGPGDSGVSHCEDHAAKYTPGPWTAERVYITRPNPDMKIVGDGLEVASVSYSDDESHTYCTTDVEIMRANARLIAAAPELLEAAQGINVTGVLVPGTDGYEVSVPRDKFNALLAAISKATGEAA